MVLCWGRFVSVLSVVVKKEKMVFLCGNVAMLKFPYVICCCGPMALSTYGLVLICGFVNIWNCLFGEVSNDVVSNDPVM